MDFIKSQVADGVFDWNSCMHLVTSVMKIIDDASSMTMKTTTTPTTTTTTSDIEAAMHAATHDHEQQPSVFVDAVKFMRSSAKKLRVVASNDRFRMVYPVIRDHGIEYSKNHIDKKLQTGELHMTCTHAWLETIIRQLAADNKIDIEDINTSDVNKASSFRMIINEAILSLVCGEMPVKECPETMLLDAKRIIDMHATFQRQVMTASILVIGSQHLRDVKSDSQIIFENIDETSITNTVDMVIKRTNLDDETCKHLRIGLVSGIPYGTPVSKLMRSRLRDAMMLSLATNAGGELFKGDVPKLQETFKTLQLPLVTISLSTSLHLACSVLHSLVSQNFKVHGSRYNDMITAICLTLV